MIIPLLASVHKEMIVSLNVELCKEGWSTCEVMNVWTSRSAKKAQATVSWAHCSAKTKNVMLRMASGRVSSAVDKEIHVALLW